MEGSLWIQHATTAECEWAQAPERRAFKAKAIHGEHYPEWVLHQATIGTMPANRVVMGPGIVPPRFRWVPYADALIFPLDNSGMAAASPDKKQLFAFEDVVGARYLKQAGLTAIPATLGEYLLQVVAATRKRGRTSSEQCRSARLCRIGEVLNGALREIVLTGTLASLENLRAKSSPELAAISAHRGWT
jgi:hypothetical protein